MSAAKTILIVEDDPAVRQMEARILQAAGYDTYEVEEGAAALALLLERRVDLVLLDVMMPGLDGMQVAQALGHHPDTKSIPLMFVTAKADRESTQAGFDAGGRVYLTKPFTATQLTMAVRTIIGSP